MCRRRRRGNCCSLVLCLFALCVRSLSTHTHAYDTLSRAKILGAGGILYLSKENRPRVDFWAGSRVGVQKGPIIGTNRKCKSEAIFIFGTPGTRVYRARTQQHSESGAFFAAGEGEDEEKGGRGGTTEQAETAVINGSNVREMFSLSLSSLSPNNIPLFMRSRNPMTLSDARARCGKVYHARTPQ